MDFEYKMQKSYRAELVFLCAMTLVFGFCCLIFGYLMLPVAAGFYAALLSAEKKENKIFSYILPLVPLTANIFINGFYSLEAIAYVAVGAIIYYGYDRKKDKALVTFFASVAVIAFMFLSMLLLAFDEIGSFEASVPMDYYTDLYLVGKKEFVSAITSFTSIDSDNIVFYKFNAAEAVDMYNSVIISFIPIISVFSLISVGIASKLLSSLMRKYDSEDARLKDWHFITTPFMAYAYLLLTALVSLSSQGIIGLSLSFVCSILMVVYYYIGICALFSFICAKKGKKFAFISIAAAHVIFLSFVPQIISFIGIFVNNTLYKNKNSTNTDVS